MNYYTLGFNNKVLVIGILPPPRGGMSVHVERLINVLNDNGSKVFHIDGIKDYSNKIFYFYKLIKALIFFKPKVVFYHNISLHTWPLELFLLTFLKFFVGYKIININHNNRFYGNLNNFLVSVYKFLFKFVDTQIFIGKSNFESFYGHFGAPKYFSIESAFIHPSKQELTLDPPKDFGLFIKNYKIILLVCASKFAQIKGKDLYGIDIALEALSYLNKDGLDAGLVIAISQGAEGYKSKYNFNQYKNILLLNEYKESMCSIILASTIFLRPTRTDGYSVSIEEAIYLKKSVIASDCVERPQGVIIFKDGDPSDLYFKIKQLIQSHNL